MGQDNKVTDALSRKNEAPTDSFLSAISYPTTTSLEDLKLSYQDDYNKEVTSKWE